MAAIDIVKLKAREILDSKGRPMVEAEVWTEGGVVGIAASPCGTSVGKHEAFVLRDGGPRYGGLGVLQAVGNVTEVIAPVLIGVDVRDQRAVDNLMIELDGTADKSYLGANATYNVSLAVARAAAQTLGVPLYRYLGGAQANLLPMPMFNLINGGRYAGVTMPIQEFLLVPVGAESYAEALRTGVEVLYQLGKTIAKRFGEDRVLTGSSLGYAAPSSDPGECIELLLEAATAAGYGDDVRVSLDCAASEFYSDSRERYVVGGQDITRAEWILTIEKLVKDYRLLSIEDPLQEDDFEGFADLTRRLDTLIIGDDLFVTNVERVR